MLCDHGELGNIWTDNIRSQVNKMEQDQDDLMSQHLQKIKNDKYITPLFTVLLILGSIIILIAAYSKIMKELKESIGSDQTLKIQK
jgi:CHASE3 domain sensor protein